ncbi:MAG: zeta toxin family protein [bacterium]|nr:zeta toxin family protein [bacterium]
MVRESTSLTEEERKLQHEAVLFVRANKKEIIKKFANDKNIPSVKHMVPVFLAGSPGAGKTEFAKSIIRIIEMGHKEKAVHIDADAIRDMLPQYDGTNAFLFQEATSIGVDHLFYYALKHSKNFVLDGTLANYKIARRNISNCVGNKLAVLVVYVYQDPITAWNFTQLREQGEGRRISQHAFIEGFLGAKANVKRLKEEFGASMKLNAVTHNYRKEDYTVYDIVKPEDIDMLARVEYSEGELKKILI